MTTSYLNVSSAGALSADILAVDLASQADGGNGTHYNITLQAGASLTVNDGDIYAINLVGNDTLTLNGQGAVLSGADTYRGLFVYSGKTTIENLTIENAVAQGGGGGLGNRGGGGGAGLGGGLFVADNPAGAAPAQVTLDNVFFTEDSAIGGAGGGAENYGGLGGGGGLGGSGGFGFSGGAGGGGVGGKTGAGAGGESGASGDVGLIPGAAGGGRGGESNAPGSGSGGGGGGGGVDGGGGGGGVGGFGGGVVNGGYGGFGGFGGGGGGGGNAGSGGGGGFGGGGGGSSVGDTGGSGGFGGGGGGGFGAGGFGGGGGGGGGANTGGGGGLGAGGDIFVMAGASLTIEGGGLLGGSVTQGSGEDGGANGQAFGSGIFLQGNESITFAPIKGTTERVFYVIADQTGSGGAGANAGAGALTLDGAGTLDLIAANTYTGGTTIETGVLELGNAEAAGRGAIHFASTSGEVEYAAGAHLANRISGFRGSDKIDFSRVAFAAGDHAVDNSGKVSIETAAGKTVATFEVSGTYTSANFKVGKDASGHVLVTHAATTAVAASGPVIGSPADILGGYAPEFAEPSWARESNLSAFDSWSALASGAGTDPGGFGFLRDGYDDGERAAWSVGVGWNGPIGGHGPGSGS